tara:strand:- start:44 stop:634 length:591 start_codon:yes stop_codon:yes gene_type:complete
MIKELFPTPIMKVDLSEILDMQDVEKRCLSIIGKLSHHKLVPDGVSSYNSDKPVITDASVKDVASFIKMHIKQMEVAMGIFPLDFSNSWINVMPVGSHIGSHIHPNSVLSGAFYLNAGEGSGEFVIENPTYGQQMSIVGQNFSEYTKTYEEISVKTGLLILFPSYLRHHVTGNDYEGRTVLSFNTRYSDKKINEKS